MMRVGVSEKATQQMKNSKKRGISRSQMMRWEAAESEGDKKREIRMA